MTEVKLLGLKTQRPSGEKVPVGNFSPREELKL